MPRFQHYDLTLLNPAFDSPLVDVITELEYLRRLELRGSTPGPLFFQLKFIFHLLESLGSARIEGNHTTLTDYVESRLEGSMQTPLPDHLREMANIEDAMDYIETHVSPGDDITERLIREFHELAVRGLKREGDATPGAYRTVPVRIALSAHLPPEAVQVSGYMQELVSFINAESAPKYDLIKVALAHHRFAWIHPFRNGNGRVVRLLTYTLLIKYGFNVRTGNRVLNPTAVFCNDRDRYYAMLARADMGSPGGLEEWSLYVLGGVLDELRKVDRLTDFSYLKSRILLPALAHARERGWVTAQEMEILRLAIESETGVVKASDLTPALPGSNSAQRTYQIKKLVEKKMLHPLNEGARQYTLGFKNSYLLRGVVRALTSEGFIPPALSG